MAAVLVVDITPAAASVVMAAQVVVVHTIRPPEARQHQVKEMVVVAALAQVHLAAAAAQALQVAMQVHQLVIKERVEMDQAHIHHGD